MKKNVIGATIAAVVLTLLMVTFGKSAISETVGLAVAQSSTLWNGVADAARGDGLTSGVLASGTYMFNGLTFDRMRGSPSGDANAATGLQAVVGLLYNGATFDRPRSSSADALAATGIVAGNNALFNGSTFDREDGVSGTNNTGTTSVGAAYAATLSTWRVIDTDAGATQSTASKAAGGGTVRHVATSVTICRGDTAAAAPALVHLRDGATGAGTIIRSWVIGVAAGLTQCENLSGLNETGSANTAMTLEFAAAGAATSTSTVTLSGYSTP